MWGIALINTTLQSGGGTQRSEDLKVRNKTVWGIALINTTLQWHTRSEDLKVSSVGYRPQQSGGGTQRSEDLKVRNKTVWGIALINTTLQSGGGTQRPCSQEGAHSAAKT